jgi:hypothetical protein
MDQASNAMANIHPLQAIQSTIGAAGGDPRPLQRASLFNNANDGPAKIIAKVEYRAEVSVRMTAHTSQTTRVFLSLILRTVRQLEGCPWQAIPFYSRNSSISIGAKI